ncbi:MAG: hypothetical protein IT317_04785 [Anaerolineales bacterium]|nr:hypothetical protein [Anaerolineales bacterium]
MTVIAVRPFAQARQAGLLLAAGGWPAAEQARKPYKPHRAAEAARRALSGLRSHPAVLSAQAVALGPGGAAALFAVGQGAWSHTATAEVADFMQQPEVAALEPAAAADWQAAETELAAVLARADLGAFLAELFGPPLPVLCAYPHLLYPGRERVVSGLPGGLLLTLPPPPAWGASPPWRYTDRPDEVLAAAAEALAAALFARAAGHPALAAQAAPLGLAAAVLFLRAAEGPDAADQFMLMEKRTRALPQLPALVAALHGKQGLDAVAQTLEPKD